MGSDTGGRVSHALIRVTDDPALPEQIHDAEELPTLVEDRHLLGVFEDYASQEEKPPEPEPEPMEDVEPDEIDWDALHQANEAANQARNAEWDAMRNRGRVASDYRDQQQSRTQPQSPEIKKDEKDRGRSR